jgi:hypothetical protein
VAITISSVIVLTVFQAGALRAIGTNYDLRHVAQVLKNFESKGDPIAHVGKYYGQYHFLGRLHKPFVILTDSQVNRWLKEHPNGKVIAYYRHKPNPAKEDILYEQPYRGHTLMVLGTRRGLREG